MRLGTRLILGILLLLCVLLPVEGASYEIYAITVQARSSDDIIIFDQFEWNASLSFDLSYEVYDIAETDDGFFVIPSPYTRSYTEESLISQYNLDEQTKINEYSLPSNVPDTPEETMWYYFIYPNDTIGFYSFYPISAGVTILYSNLQSENLGNYTITSSIKDITRIRHSWYVDVRLNYNFLIVRNDNSYEVIAFDLALKTQKSFFFDNLAYLGEQLLGHGAALSMNNNNLYAVVGGGSAYLSLVSYNNNSWTKELTLSEDYDIYKIFKYGTWYQDTYIALYYDRDEGRKFDIDIWNITSQSLIDSSNFTFELTSRGDGRDDWQPTAYSQFYIHHRVPEIKKNDTHFMLDYKYNIATYDGNSWSTVTLSRDSDEYFITSIPISNNWRIEMFSSYKVSLADQLKWPLIFVATIVVIILAVRYYRRPRQKQYDYVYFNEEKIWRER